MKRLSPRETAEWRSFVLMGLITASRVEKSLIQESKLSGIDFSILTCLIESKDQTLRQVEIQNIIGWDKSRLSHHLSRMSARKLIKRESVDGKTAIIHITALGRQRHSVALPVHAKAVRKYFLNHVSSSEMTTLIMVAKKLKVVGVRDTKNEEEKII